MTVPELNLDPGALAAHMAAVSARALEIELEIRRAKVRWAAVLCSCTNHHPAECQVHGMFLVLPDGRVV